MNIPDLLKTTFDAYICQTLTDFTQTDVCKDPSQITSRITTFAQPLFNAIRNTPPTTAAFGAVILVMGIGLATTNMAIHSIHSRLQETEKSVLHHREALNTVVPEHKSNKETITAITKKTSTFNEAISRLEEEITSLRKQIKAANHSQIQQDISETT